jgi:hypothetical protein
LVDRRHGARFLMSTGAVVGGMGLIATGLVQRPLHFYLAFGVAGCSPGHRGPPYIRRMEGRRRGAAMVSRSRDAPMATTVQGAVM